MKEEASQFYDKTGIDLLVGDELKHLLYFHFIYLCRLLLFLCALVNLPLDE